MTTLSVHLTRIGSGDFLLEPKKSLDIRDQGRHIENITAHLLKARASRLYYDLSSLTLIDPLYYAWLDALARAAQAINVRMICVNIQPTAAFAMAQYINKKPVFDTAHTI